MNLIFVIPLCLSNIYEYKISVKTQPFNLEVVAYKTKYMIMSRDQNAGRSHSMKIDNT